MRRKMVFRHEMHPETWAEGGMRNAIRSVVVDQARELASGAGLVLDEASVILVEEEGRLVYPEEGPPIELVSTMWQAYAESA